MATARSPPGEPAKYRGALVEAAGTGQVRFMPWPEDRRSIDIGSVYVDDAKIRRTLGWQPRVDWREGLECTVAFYWQHRSQYWPG